MNKKRAALIAGFALFAFPAEAAEMILRLDKNKVMLGEPANLDVIVEGAGNMGEPKIVIPSGLSVYSQSKSQRVEIVNFRMSQSVIYTLTLVGSQADSYKLGPAALDIGGGQVLTSNEVTLVVADQQSTQVPGTPQGVLQPFKQPQFRRSVDEMRGKKEKPQASQPRGGGSKHAPDKAENPPAEAPPLSFVETRISKKQAFVGEPVYFAVNFYTRVPFISQPQYKPPPISGFWHEELPQRTRVEERNGVRYSVTEIPMVLFPSAAGKLEIGQARITVELENENASGPMDPFDPQFFQRFFSAGMGQTHVLQTNKVSVEALPLPAEGRPSDFSGAVGQYEIEAEADKKEIRVGDTLTLTVTIKGTGNIKGLPSPVYPNLDGVFRSYETEKSENVSKQGGSISGSKVYKLLLIPQIPGRPDLAIGPVRFSYFDPASKTYVRKQTQPISLRVTGEPLAQAGGGSKKEGDLSAKKLSEDIRYLVAEVPQASAGGRAAAALSRHWIPVSALPVIWWAGTWLVSFSRKKKALGARNPLTKLAGAMTQAKRLAAQNKVTEAIHLLAPALETAAVEVLRPGVKGAAIGARAVLDHLIREGGGALKEEEAKTIQKLLEDLHFVRFAPAAAGEAQEVLQDLLERMEQAKKILEQARR